MECPSAVHIVNLNATKSPAKHDVGRIKFWNYSYKLSISEEANAKIICVIGKTGTGKTTLLNTLVNYCLGV